MPKFEHTIALLDSFLELGIPGFDFELRRHGEVLLRHHGGFSDREKEIPMTGRERYNIYSCSKPITCAAALQLWERGLFRLEDELCEYMPEFTEMKVRTPSGEIVPARKRITVYNLFTMTAGFNYNLSAPAILRCFDATHGAVPTRECIRFLAEDPLDFEPGSDWRYSLCHDVLAALVEVVSGMPFNDYVTQHIFNPLGMKESTYLLPAVEMPALAAQYRWCGDGGAVPIGPRNSYRFGADYASGGAGCVSTMDDYMRFVEAIREGESILGRKTIQMMAAPQLSPELRKRYMAVNDTRYTYGLGIRSPFVEGSNCSDIGWGGAAGAYLVIDLKNDLTAVYLQHVLNSPNAAQRRTLPDTIRQDLGL